MLQIEGLKKSLEFCHKEVTDLKQQNTILKEQCSLLKKKVEDLKFKMDEANRYNQRLNLRLYGAPEKADDNIKSCAEEICCRALAGTEATAIISGIDVIHRVGKCQDESSNIHRAVIIRFTSRIAQDTLWKVTKKCDYLKNNWLRFKEDLTAADRENHSKLWPAVEEAQKRGEKANYMGNRAYINGKEIKV